MNAIPMLIFVILALIFIGSTLRQPLQQIGRLRRAARGPIGTLPAPGLVGVAGQVSGEALTCPLSGVSCVLWQVLVERHRNKRWQPVYQKASTVEISLNDGTGWVQIAPAGAELFLADDLRQSRGFLRRLDPEIELKLEALRIEVPGFWSKFGSQVRVFERYIVAGKSFSALGYAERTGGPLVLKTTPDTPLLLADQTLDQVLRRLYWRVALTLGLIALIIGAFSGCLLLQYLEPR